MWRYVVLILITIVAVPAELIETELHTYAEGETELHTYTETENENYGTELHTYTEAESGGPIMETELHTYTEAISDAPTDAPTTASTATDATEGFTEQATEGFTEQATEGFTEPPTASPTQAPTQGAACAEDDEGVCGCGWPELDLNLDGITDCLGSTRHLLNQRLYTLHQVPQPFEAARQTCLQQKAHLVQPSTPMENNFLAAEMEYAGLPEEVAVWIGMELGSDGTWGWVDPDVPDTVDDDFRNWSTSADPSGAGPFCATMYQDGVWVKEDCDVALPFICEAYATFDMNTSVLDSLNHPEL